MKIKNIMTLAIKWLKRLALAYMLGFASVMNVDTKRMEDNYFKIEQREDIEE